MRNTLKRISNSLRHRLGFQNYFRKSYSQMAEDMIAANFIDGQSGFYLDIGAYHPKRFSNTYFFYERGWRGINVDGSAEAIRLLKKCRKRDISIQALIGPDKEAVTFYEFAQRELNTTVASSLPDILKFHGQQPLRVSTMPSMSMETLLDRFLPAGTSIDLMNVDAEGADEMILQTNDWTKYVPKIIIVEKHTSIVHFLESSLFLLLSSKYYHLVGFCKHAFVLKHESA